MRPFGPWDRANPPASCGLRECARRLSGPRASMHAALGQHRAWRRARTVHGVHRRACAGAIGAWCTSRALGRLMQLGKARSCALALVDGRGSCCSRVHGPEHDGCFAVAPAAWMRPERRPHATHVSPQDAGGLPRPSGPEGRAKTSNDSPTVLGASRHGCRRHMVCPNFQAGKPAGRGRQKHHVHMNGQPPSHAPPKPRSPPGAATARPRASQRTAPAQSDQTTFTARPSTNDAAHSHHRYMHERRV